MDLRGAVDSLAGTGAEIGWVFSFEENGNWLEIEGAIAALGKAARRTTVYEGDEKAPYVIEYIEAKVCGILLRAQWSRPATDEEIDKAQGHEDRRNLQRSFTATRLVG